MLINVSNEGLGMLMGRTSRLAIEVLVELTGQGSQKWMKPAELGRRIDAEVPLQFEFRQAQAGASGIR